MQLSDIQAVLAAAGYYTGGIDGQMGPKTLVAIDRALDGVGSRWSSKRRTVGAAQVALNALGLSAGSVDGYAGHNTREALAAWRYEGLHGKPETVSRRASNGAPAPSKLPAQRDVAAFYGRPGSEIKSRLKTVDLPFPLWLDWNLSARVSRVTLHQKCTGPFVAALSAVRDSYGAADMRRLGIDRYAGGYNHRKMRGGNKWSMHAYGCAVDFYAAPNGLRTRCPDALFCRPEYKDFLDIMEAHGWLPAIRLWGADAMHFQMARLK